MKLLKTDACLARDIGALIKIEPKFADAYEVTGSLELRRRADGYASLVRTIVGQQVSVASAEAIWRRLDEANLTDLVALKCATQEELLACGLSRQKASYLSHLAHAGIDFEGLATRSDSDVHKELTQVKGIGPWTAEIFLMFSLGRADVFAPADLALQESVKLLFEMEKRPTEKELAKRAEDWSPYRNAAAQLLWAYYHVMKKRDGIGV